MAKIHGTIVLGNSSGTAAEGNDSRLSDARTPTAHEATHAAAGSDPITISESQVTNLVTDLAGKVGTSDSRLTDARTPTAHEATHAANGSDPITISESQVTNLTTDLSGKVSTSALGAASGVATLGSDGKLTAGQLPAIAITDTFAVSSQAAMLALAAQTGDVAIRSDISATFILQGSDPTQLASWVEFLSPTGAPQSHAASHAAAGSDPVTISESQVTNLTTDLAGKVGTSDSRLSDARTPTSHASTHASAGSDPLTIAESQVTNLTTDLAAKQATSGKNAANGYAGLDASSKLTGSQQVYGTTANTAAQGNDSRLSDARTPTTHASTHAAGGSDPVTISDSQFSWASSGNITAFAAGGQASATVIGSADTIITTAAAGSSVKFATIATAGARGKVYNAGANDVSLYPSGTGTINGGTASASYLVPSGYIAFWEQLTAGVNGNFRVIVVPASNIVGELVERGANAITGGAASFAVTAFATGGVTNAIVIGTQDTVVTACATAGDSIKFPTFTSAGARGKVFNQGVAYCNLFVPGTGTINGGSSGGFVSIPPGGVCFWEALTAGVNGNFQVAILTSWDANAMPQYTVTAHAGGGQASAVAISSYNTIVTTCATAGDSIKFPTIANIGAEGLIINAGAASCNLFPSGTGNINGGTASAAFPIPAGSACFWQLVTAGVNGNFRVAVFPTSGLTGTLNLAAAAFGTPGAITVGAAAAAGSAATLAHSDHVHSLASGTPGAITVGAAASAGVATSVAASDHVHSVASGTPGAVAPGSSASAGVAATFAASDHVHSMAAFATPGALTVGATAAAGSASTFARSDHVHSAPAYGTGAGTFAQGNDSRIVAADNATKLQATLTPTGTTQTIDWSLGNSVILNLGSATGAVAITLTNPVAGNTYVIEIAQGATPRAVTFSPTPTYPGGTVFVASTSANQVDIVTLFWNGSTYRLSANKAYA